MNNALPSFLMALPEIFLLGMACVILVLDLFLAERHRIITYGLSQFALLITALLVPLVYSGKAEVGFSGVFVLDGMAVTLKIAICLVSIWVFLYSREYLAARNLFKGEYHVLGLFGVLGMLVMVSAHSLLTIYLGLELLSLSLYAMVAFNRDNISAAEAAMKYFVLGALASGMLLYGMSMIYGSTGSLNIADIGARIASQPGGDLVLVFGLVFLVVGLAFKFGAVPFHMWLPDVYQGAPTSVTLYLSAAPKIAAFAMTMRLLSEGMGSLYAEWRDMLTILVLLSLAVGNIVAIAQTNIKRMLAYSTISHVGFLLLGVLAATEEGYAAAMFYVITYAVMAMGAFGVVLLLSRAGFEADSLDDFKGLNDRNSWYAFMMMILMFSMAGVPLTVGFFAKLQVIQAAIQVGMVWLAVAAVLFSVIGAFYYLRIVKLMYFDKAQDNAPLLPARDTQFALTLNGLAVLGLGIFPGALIRLCGAAFT